MAMKTQRLAWAAFFAAGGLLWLGLLNQLRVEWTLNPQYQYGWGVPFLALYLFLDRWRLRPPPASSKRQPAFDLLVILLALLLLPLRVVQEANPDWRAVSWLYAVIVVTQTLWAFRAIGGNAWVKHFAVPIAFILIAVPWPSALESDLVQGLMRTVAAITVELLNWFGVPAWQRGNLIELTTGVVGVDEACSGVRSLQSTLMAGFFLGELYRLGARGRCLLILLGLVLSGLLNVLRSFLLTWVAASRGPAALQSWHDPAGWLILVIAVGLLWCIAVRRQRHEATRTAGVPDQPPEVERSVPPLHRLNARGLWAFAIWFVAVEGLTELWFRGHERDILHRGSLAIRWPEERNGFRSQPVSENTRLILRSDQVKAATWERLDGSFWQIYFVHWYPGRISTQVARVHRPEACLPAVGLSLVSAEGTVSVPLGNWALVFQRYEFESRGTPLYVFFSLWEDRVAPNRTTENIRFDARGRLLDAWHGRRHLGQQMFEIAISGVKSAADAEQMLTAFLRERLYLYR